MDSRGYGRTGRASPRARRATGAAHAGRDVRTVRRRLRAPRRARPRARSGSRPSSSGRSCAAPAWSSGPPGGPEPVPARSLEAPRVGGGGLGVVPAVVLVAGLATARPASTRRSPRWPGRPCRGPRPGHSGGRPGRRGRAPTASGRTGPEVAARPRDGGRHGSGAGTDRTPAPTSGGAGVIEFDRVTVTYAGAPRPVLRDVRLPIEEGELALVVGRTGVGKSTLLGAVNGLVPTSPVGRWPAGCCGRTGYPRPSAPRAGRCGRRGRPGPAGRFRDRHRRGGAGLRHGAAGRPGRRHAQAGRGDPRSARDRRAPGPGRSTSCPGASSSGWPSVRCSPPILASWSSTSPPRPWTPMPPRTCWPPSPVWSTTSASPWCWPNTASSGSSSTPTG